MIPQHFNLFGLDPIKNYFYNIILTHIEENFVPQKAKVNDAYHNGCIIRMRIQLAVSLYLFKTTPLLFHA